MKRHGAFGISFPDFPGCISTASTIDEVIAKGGQALTLHVEGMMEDKEALPHLRGVRELRADPELADWFEDATVAAISVDLPKRAVRI
jgi:predicted RNase H-like HicB family nuclease